MIVAILFLNGCSDDLQRSPLVQGGTVEVCLSYTVDKDGPTRSFFRGESSIDHAYLLFYTEEASIDSSVPEVAVRAEAADGKLKFKVPLILQENTRYKILAIANADYFVPDGFSSFGAFLESLRAGSAQDFPSGIELFHSGALFSSSLSSLPMRGELSDGLMFSFSINNGLYNLSRDVSLTFYRLVARVDVINSASSVFTLEGIALCNWRDAVSVIDPESNAGEVRGVLTEEGIDLGDDDFIPVEEEPTGGVQQLISQIYCFPSQTSDSRQGDTSTTALILKARFGEDVESSYYRVNIGTGDFRGKIKANTKYNVVISSVKGRGASTALEAYTSSESLVMLSVVEDWDLEGNFAMDDDGNFIVVSRSSLEFAAEGTETQMLRLITSKGLDWQVEYVPSDAASEGAFVVGKISESIVSVGTTKENESETALSGVCRFTATVQGAPLVVDVFVLQNAKGSISVDPWLPDVAIVPDNDERVKIDYDNHTIEIDGFAPEVFNSFIDIPFKAHLADSFGPDATLDVCLDEEAPLAWPLEGRISKDASSRYHYCVQSFDDVQNSQVNNKETGNNVFYKALYQPSLSLSNGEHFYISVGAMAPDDPAIVRNLILKVNGAGSQEQITYTLTIKPRQVIIDDVILTDESGISWVIMDRNLEDLRESTILSKAGRDSAGRRSQAYHYCGYNAMKIPCKSGNEKLHPEREGLVLQFSQGYTLWWTGLAYSLPNWLSKYKYNSDGNTITSPFYGGNIGSEWKLPTEDVLTLCASKMHVSKMRMFLVSEWPVKKDGHEYPVCCYFPYSGNTLESTATNVNGYFSGKPGDDEVNSIFVICASSHEMKTLSSSSSSRSGLVRLVHQLDSTSLEDYKNNYLGYGSASSNLLPCHPDLPVYW